MREGADRWGATRQGWPIACLGALCPPGGVKNPAASNKIGPFTEISLAFPHRFPLVFPAVGRYPYSNSVTLTLAATVCTHV